MNDRCAASATPTAGPSGERSREEARAILVEHLSILVVREHQRRLAADRENRRAPASDSLRNEEL